MLGQIKKPDPIPTPVAGKELDTALKELLVSLFSTFRSGTDSGAATNCAVNLKSSASDPTILGRSERILADKD